MKPFDNRLQKDLFPKTPAVFRRMIKEKLSDVCSQSENEQNETVRFAKQESDRQPVKKTSRTLTRVGTVAVAAILVISMLAVGTIAVLARREKPTPAVSAGEQPEETPEANAGNTVYAATVDEFLAAIAPDTKIVLTGGTYNLSTASDYGANGGPYYTWKAVDDGYELLLRNLNGFTLIGSENTVIKAEPRHASVIDAEYCTDLLFANFTAGHTILSEEECSGPVLLLSDCTNARVENCALFGCGRVGVDANGCDALTVVGCDIYECSQSGISLFQCQNVSVSACKVRDCGLRKLSGETEPSGAEDAFFIGECEHVRISNCDVFGNKALSVFGGAEIKDIVLSGMLVYDNDLVNVIDVENGELTVYGCEFRYDGDTFLYRTTYPYSIFDENGNRIGESELAAMTLTRDVP